MGYRFRYFRLPPIPSSCLRTNASAMHTTSTTVQVSSLVPKLEIELNLENVTGPISVCALNTVVRAWIKSASSFPISPRDTTVMWCHCPHRVFPSRHIASSHLIDGYIIAHLADDQHHHITLIPDIDAARSPHKIPVRHAKVTSAGSHAPYPLRTVGMTAWPGVSPTQVLGGSGSGRPQMTRKSPALCPISLPEQGAHSKGS